MIDEKEKIFKLFYEIVGDGGCAGDCTESELYQQDGEWKLFLCGFMEPWRLGRTLDEVEANLRQYAAQGHGLSMPS
jgi:hypothetical protein